MNSREAVIEEIRIGPEPVVEEDLDFVRFLKSKPGVAEPASAPREIPDFQARKKAIFGDRVLLDSQAILDELRADRLECAILIPVCC